MIPGSANPLLLATAAPTGYNIERSLRFNSSDSAYLSRTPASAGNRKTWTWAGWVKRSELGRVQNIFRAVGALTDTTVFQLRFMSNNAIGVVNYSYFPLISAPVYRDTSAWYHLVVALDTTQATAANRLRFYINGIEITTWATDNRASLTQNSDQGVNQASVAHQIGGQGTSEYFSGYLADIHFIDGQALTPTSFGEFDTNGVWQPKAFSGSYGTNGFRLNFSNNSAATAAALGADSSGNGNNWTPTNLSVTAGAGNDSLVDTPTSYGTGNSGGDVRGNYCTWNPLANGAGALSNGNLDLGNSGPDTRCNSTISVSSGKWYYEIRLNTLGTNSSAGIGQNQIINTWPGNDALSYAYELDNARTAQSGSLVAYGSALTAGDIFMCAFDLDNSKIFFGKNGTWFNSSNPATGTNPAFTLAAGSYCPIGRPYGGGSFSLNTGQRPFAYTAPSGFKALCDTNLPSTTITTSGSYTGNGVADGPFVYLNGVPTAMTVNGNAVTFGTHADKLSNGFKIRTTSTTYNQNASTYNYSITSTGDPFKRARAQANP